MDLFVFLIDALCVYRLARLITKDSLFDKPRWWVLRRWPSELTTFPNSIVDIDDSGRFGHLTDSRRPVFLTEDGEWVAEKTYKLSELVECPFCVSVWLAFGVVALRVWWDWWQYPALALGLAGAVALIFSLWDND